MCSCASNPCGCASEIELPYLTGTAGAAGANGSNGADAPTVDTIDSALTGTNLTFTFTFSDDSTIESTVNLSNLIKAYVLEATTGDPIATYDNSNAGVLSETLLIIPEGTLTQNGDLVQFEYQFETKSGIDTTSFDLLINGSSTGTVLFASGMNKVIYGEIIRVSNTNILITFYTNAGKIISGETPDSGLYHLQNFITVSSLTTNAISLSVELNSVTGGGEFKFNKGRTIVIKK